MAASLRAFGLVAVSCVVVVWLLPDNHPVRRFMDEEMEGVFLNPPTIGVSVGNLPDPEWVAPAVPVDIAPKEPVPPTVWSPPPPPVPPVAPPPLALPGMEAVPAFPLPPHEPMTPPSPSFDEVQLPADVRLRMNEVRAALGVGWAFDEEGVLWTDGGQLGQAFRDPRDWAGLFPALGIRPERIVFVPGQTGDALPIFVEIERGQVLLHRPESLSDRTGAPDHLAIDIRSQAAGPFQGGWRLDQARPFWRADAHDGGVRGGAILFAFPTGELSPLSLTLDTSALGEPGAPWPAGSWRVHGAEGGPNRAPSEPTLPAFDAARRASALETVSGFLGDPQDLVREKSELLADWMDTDARTLVVQGDPLEGWSPLRPFAVATWHTGVDVVALTDGSVWSRSGGAWSQDAQAVLWTDMSGPFIVGPPTENLVLGNASVDSGVVSFVLAHLDEQGRPTHRVLTHWQAPGEWLALLGGPVVARTVLLEGGVRAVIRFQSLDTGMVGFVRLSVAGTMPVESTTLFNPEGEPAESADVTTPFNRVQAFARLPEDVRAEWSTAVAWPTLFASRVSAAHESIGGTWDPQGTALSVGAGHFWAMDRLQLAWYVPEGGYERRVAREGAAFFRGLMDENVVDGRIPFVVALPDGFAISGWIPKSTSVGEDAYVVGVDSGVWEGSAVLPPPEKLKWVDDDTSGGVPWSRVVKAYAWPDGGMLLRLENANGDQVDMFWDMQSGAVRRFW